MILQVSIFGALHVPCDFFQTKNNWLLQTLNRAIGIWNGSRKNVRSSTSDSVSEPKANTVHQRWSWIRGVYESTSTNFVVRAIKLFGDIFFSISFVVFSIVKSDLNDENDIRNVRRFFFSFCFVSGILLASIRFWTKSNRRRKSKRDTILFDSICWGENDKCSGQTASHSWKFIWNFIFINWQCLSWR